MKKKILYYALLLCTLGTACKPNPKSSLKTNLEDQGNRQADEASENTEAIKQSIEGAETLQAAQKIAKDLDDKAAGLRAQADKLNEEVKQIADSLEEKEKACKGAYDTLNGKLEEHDKQEKKDNKLRKELNQNWTSLFHKVKSGSKKEDGSQCGRSFFGFKKKDSPNGSESSLKESDPQVTAVTQKLWALVAHKNSDLSTSSQAVLSALNAFEDARKALKTKLGEQATAIAAAQQAEGDAKTAKDALAKRIKEFAEAAAKQKEESEKDKKAANKDGK